MTLMDAGDAYLQYLIVEKVILQRLRSLIKRICLSF